MNRLRDSHLRRRGTTLMELMLALTILAILCTSVFTLLIASNNTDVYSRGVTSGMWDADFAYHRIVANGMAAITAANGGMTPTITTDANGQARVTFIVPDIANSTTRTLTYYCTGAAAPFSLVEDDARYDVGGQPNVIASNVKSFSGTLDATTTMKIWVTLNITPPESWTVQRHFCVNCRNF